MFESVILSFVAPVTEEITQPSDQDKTRLIPQLISGISRVSRKLLKHFNDTAISTSFVLPAAGFFPVILILKANGSDCVIVLMIQIISVILPQTSKCF